MNLLIETRNSYATKLAKVIKERDDYIDAEVAKYKAQLEASCPTTEIDGLKSVIASLDNVIAYESNLGKVTMDSSYVGPEPIQETKQVQEHFETRRTGMADIALPERR